MAESAGSDESPWTKGEAEFKRCVFILIRNSFMSHCVSACFDLIIHPFLQDSPFFSKAYSKYFDPCQEAASRSIKCLHRNGGDRQMCTDYFQ